MPRFVGVKNGSIRVVSNASFVNDNLTILELSEDLKNLSSQEIILNYCVKNNQIQLKNKFIPYKDLKIAFISNYKQACGISTYFENLIGSIKDKINNYRLFVENNEQLDSFDDNVIQCWKRGEDLTNLISEINKYDPDIILIQHEFGLFPVARYWISLMTQLSKYKTIVTMHSVFPYHQDKTIVEACMKNIVVHSEETKKSLIETKGLNSNITVIPHGCYTSKETKKLWNFYKSNHTFVQIGFGFEYKAFEECIKATALLKDKYQDVYFTALFSESPSNKIIHENYYSTLLDLINDLNLQNHVGIIRGFQSDSVIDSFLRTNQVSVFPYKISNDNFVFGASGAARLAMSKCIPVITSNIPHFRDLPTIKIETAEDIAKELDKLFTDKKEALLQVDKQNKFIKDNSWEVVGNKYLELFENT